MTDQPERWANRLTVRRLRREAFMKRPRWPKAREAERLDRELDRVWKEAEDDAGSRETNRR